MKGVVHCWLDLGLYGFRCDVVSNLFERKGTNCESLPEIYACLKDSRRMIDREYLG